MQSKNRTLIPRAALRLLLGLFLLGSMVPLSRPASSFSASQRPAVQEPGEVIFRGVSTAVRFDISPPLRSIPPAELDPDFAFEDRDPPSGLEGPLGPQDVDPVVQDAVGPQQIPAPLISFDGFSNQAGYTPPDPVGDVGPDHYVAMSNVHFAVYDKEGNLLYGPVPNNTLWDGFGGDCETNNAGDPIVVYDQLADRWMLTQFTSSGPTYYNCVALSTSGDPTGTYYRYAFSTGPNFPDYPKYGVWPDAYYISTREFDAGFQGIGAYALNRAEMLAGNPAPQVVSFLATPGGSPYNVGDGLLPSDMDGDTPPPAGSPNYYVGSMDDGAQYGAPQDALTIWEFHVDWATPGNSSFSLAHTLPTAPFDSIFPCSPGSRDCIPQPDTSEKVDILSYRQRPMWRLAYRNFGGYEALVTNQSVEAGPNMAGMRWYEVRDPGGAPTIYQQGTYAPGIGDGVHRWMGSIAQDRQGNMALGYSASDGVDTYPSSWYTGRLVSDPLGAMLQGEGVFVDGLGSQLSTGSRWGDYTSMNVDPVDDCTFWYINEYYPTTSYTGWRLRIGAFRFPSCTDAAVADLSIDVGGPNLVSPGDPFTYTLHTANAGPSDIPSTISNPQAISFLDNSVADPYPATLEITGVNGILSKVTATLYDLNHTYPDDIDVILVGPGGESTYLMSDAGGQDDLVDVTVTFDDDAAGPLPDNALIAPGSYQPTDYGFGDTFPSPAPGGPYSQSLSVFAGTDPNGTWDLFVVDDENGDVGSIAGGWALTLYLTGVEVVDYLPAEVTFDGLTAPGWTCDQAGQLITCTTPIMPVGAAPDIVIDVTAPSTTGIILSNVASITSSLTDPDPSNNSNYHAVLVDTPPLGVDDFYTATEDVTRVVPAPGVLDNDYDADGDPLSAYLIISPTHGSVDLAPDGGFVYVPDPDYNGSDVFTYTVTDGPLADYAKVTIDVAPVNDAPIVEAGPDQAGDEGAVLAFSGSFVDPGLRLAGETIEWDFGDGTAITGTLTPTHAYGDEGVYTVTLTVTDTEGAAGMDTLLATIANVAPVLGPLPDRDVHPSVALTITGVLTDPGWLDAHQVVLDWDDGTTETLALAPGAAIFEVDHAYEATGVYTVTVVVDDGDGGQDGGAFLVTVNPFRIYLPLALRRW